MTKVRFQADADFNEIIIKALLRREPKVDFQTATQLKLEGVDDLEVLQLSADAGRILITHDRRTIPSHFATFIQDRTSSGVVVSKKLATRQVVDDLLLIWLATEMDEWQNRIIILPL